MNNKKLLFFSVAALLGCSTLTAQTTNWQINGNALPATGKFGSTSNQDVQFISNNTVNGLLHRTGRWGFGLSNLPSAKVQINSAANEDAFRVQVGGNTKLVLAKNGGLTVGANIINPPAAGLFVQGNTGLGTSTPLSKLHVQSGSSGITPFFQSMITAENSTNAYISILAPSANETGVLFGTSANNVEGGIIYNSTFLSPAKNGLQFRTNGNIPRMILNKDGLLNVGPGGTDDYRVRIDHSSVLGLDIANSSKGTDWEFFAGDDGLQLFADGGVGGFHGLFSRTTGLYSVQSDERVKTNIKPMASVLKKISQLKPASYLYKNTKDQQVYDGFIAQEIMKVFPNLVTHTVDNERKIDLYTMNYSGFGVIAIKAIQELMKINEVKDAAIDNLQKQIDELKAVVLKGAQSNVVADAKIRTTLNDAVLEQNAPNPFSNTTTIRYSIPQKFITAQLVIHDNSGKVIKQVKISDGGKGSVNVDASILSAGTYTYSLIVDGKMISTKQMVLTK